MGGRRPAAGERRDDRGGQRRQRGGTERRRARHGPGGRRRRWRARGARTAVAHGGGAVAAARDRLGALGQRLVRTVAGARLRRGEADEPLLPPLHPRRRRHGAFARGRPRHDRPRPPERSRRGAAPRVGDARGDGRGDPVRRRGDHARRADGLGLPSGPLRRGRHRWGALLGRRLFRQSAARSARARRWRDRPHRRADHAVRKRGAGAGSGRGRAPYERHRVQRRPGARSRRADRDPADRPRRRRRRSPPRRAGGDAAAPDRAARVVSESSKLDTRWSQIERLRDLGRHHAAAWLRDHGPSVGCRSTLDALPPELAA